MIETDATLIESYQGRTIEGCLTPQRSVAPPPMRLTHHFCGSYCQCDNCFSLTRQSVNVTKIAVLKIIISIWCKGGNTVRLNYVNKNELTPLS